MATARLQTSREQRAAEIPTGNILPALPDGRNVIIGKHGFHLTSTERCDCGDRRFKKVECFHMLRLIQLKGGQ